MVGWLQKILPPAAPPQGKSRAVQAMNGKLPASSGRPVPPTASLPNATIIYGIGAGVLGVAALSLMLAGRWFPGFLVFVLAACLLGFALHLLKHQE